MSNDITKADWDALVRAVKNNTERLETLNRLLSGGDRLGFLSKVAIMWQVWVWGVPLVSMIIGGLIVGFFTTGGI
jgi:hypothetical protein